MPCGDVRTGKEGIAKVVAWFNMPGKEKAPTHTRIHLYKMILLNASQ